MESMQNLFETLSELYEKPPLLDEMNQIVNAVEKDKAEALNISVVGGSKFYDCDECAKFPCALQKWSSDKNKKLRFGDCGEKVKINLTIA